MTGWTTANALVVDTNEGGAMPGHVPHLTSLVIPRVTRCQQIFATTAGQTYRLTFDSGIFNTTTSPLQLNVQVTGGSTRLNRSVTPPKPVQACRLELPVHFRGRSASDHLLFTDIGTGNGGTDTLLDNVFVSSTPTPTPGRYTIERRIETSPYDQTARSQAGASVDLAS